MKEDIDEILSDYLNREPISDEEKHLMEEWKHASTSNKRFGELIRNLEQKKNILAHHRSQESVFAKVQYHICQKRRQQRRLLWSACAAGITLFMGFFFLLQQNQETTPLSQTLTAGLAHNQAATELILPNGERHVLNSKKNTVIVSDSTGKMSTSEKTLIVESNENVEKKTEYYTLNVPLGGEYNLILAEGTKIYLNAGTTLRYPDQFTGKNREVFLDGGEAYFEVTPDASQPFIVHTADITVRVLGTSFNVNAYPEETCVKTTLVEGRVETQCGDRTIVMTPGTQVVYNKEARNTTYLPVDPRYFVSWKEGYYDFEDMPLEELMRIFSRWYNINIRFADQELKKLKFSGRLKRYEDVKPLFDMLEYTRDVTFGEENGGIVIQKK